VSLFFLWGILGALKLEKIAATFSKKNKLNAKISITLKTSVDPALLSLTRRDLEILALL
jgi:hypothetical protein